LKTGFHSTAEKEKVVNNQIVKNAPTEAIKHKPVLMERLDSLAIKVDESTNFRVKKNTPSNFSKAEKKVAQALLEVLTLNFERSSELLLTVYILSSLEELQSGGKK